MSTNRIKRELDTQQRKRPSKKFKNKQKKERAPKSQSSPCSWTPPSLAVATHAIPLVTGNPLPESVARTALVQPTVFQTPPSLAALEPVTESFANQLMSKFLADSVEYLEAQVLISDTDDAETESYLNLEGFQGPPPSFKK